MERPIVSFRPMADIRLGPRFELLAERIGCRFTKYARGMLMIATLIAIQVMQPQTIMRSNSALVKPNEIATARVSKPTSQLAQARNLLASAEGVRANYVPIEGQPTRAELDASIDEMKSDLDSMSEMGEMESLRMQMAMDRMSKMMATLSNLLKKISDTQSSIVQNIK